MSVYRRVSAVFAVVCEYRVSFAGTSVVLYLSAVFPIEVAVCQVSIDRKLPELLQANKNRRVVAVAFLNQIQIAG